MLYYIRVLLLFIICVDSALAMPSSGFADLVDQLSPAVVNISSKHIVTTRRSLGFGQLPGNMFPFEDDILNRFFPELMRPGDDDNDHRDMHQQAVSLGSGFIIDKDGYIVTNHHVIENADEIGITLSNKEEFIAKIIGVDSKTDLALLKIDATHPLPYVKFGNSERARVGDWVIAIGNPFGLEGTVTAGVISGLSRNIGNLSVFNNFIQTDAAINKGNSGGPMFNMAGEVIGVNNALLSPSGTNAGVGFAIPSTMSKSIVEELRRHGIVKKGTLGVTLQELTHEVAESLAYKGKGVMVNRVFAGSSAEKAGVKQYDIIHKYDNVEIQGVKDLQLAVYKTKLGKKVSIEVFRQGKYITLRPIISSNNLNVDVVDNDASTQKNKHGNTTTSSLEWMGINVVNLDEKVRQILKIEKQDIQGIAVLSVKPHTRASYILRRGDVIAAINQKHVRNIAEFKDAIKEARTQKRNYIMISIYRNNQYLITSLDISKN